MYSVEFNILGVLKFMGNRSSMSWWIGCVICSLFLISVPVKAQPNNSTGEISSPAGATPDDIVGQVSTHFKRRWQNDPNFDQDLEYQIDLQADGQVQKIVGLNNNSRLYLAKTQFLQVGDQLVTTSDRNHVLWLVLGARGVVRVSMSPPPNAIISPASEPKTEVENIVASKIQKYFQRRWSAKNNTPESLQYKVNIGSNGRILSVESVNELSRTYLKKARFINVGERIIRPRRSRSVSTGESAKLSAFTIRVIFAPNGEVQTLLDS
jgi:hypothetical protein